MLPPPRPRASQARTLVARFLHACHRSGGVTRAGPSFGHGPTTPDVVGCFLSYVLLRPSLSTVVGVPPSLTDVCIFCTSTTASLRGPARASVTSSCLACPRPGTMPSCARSQWSQYSYQSPRACGSNIGTIFFGFALDDLVPIDDTLIGKGRCSMTCESQSDNYHDIGDARAIDGEGCEECGRVFVPGERMLWDDSHGNAFCDDACARAWHDRADRIDGSVHA